ncbi:DUF3631 domain-containing protein [Gordonia amicalis]|nr:DUF3631 domain-containing protein [Gordonia amicalis]
MRPANSEEAPAPHEDLSKSVATKQSDALDLSGYQAPASVDTLSAEHRDMLAASGVTPEYAELRGYFTVGDKQWLDRANIARPGRVTPGLMIPMHAIDGSVWGYQYRPDKPRLRQGKPVKYETPHQQKNRLDVPPGIGPKLSDPTIPLWITEGVKKADCGALRGLCIVALAGVWNWMTTSTAGSKMALEEFREIALKGRRVIIAFDGDVARKPAVQKASAALASYLAYKGARVEYLHLPDTDDKTGLDDYLVEHTVDELMRLVKPHQAVPVDPARQRRSGTDGTDRTDVAGPRRTTPDGSVLLKQVEDFLSRFVAYPSDSALVAHVLWIAHTWLMDAWESTPRIAFLSPEPGSGKSRALEVTEPLVPRPVHAVNTTPAYLFRKVSDDDGAPTILYDEIDTVFGPRAKDNEDIRGMLNAGHRKGATAGRCVIRGKNVETEELPAYCAVALAGLDDLPDTIMTRSVIVRMRRRAPGERVEPWRLRLVKPEADLLREDIAAWAKSVERQAGSTWPDMPDGVEDRDADVWEALVAVADLAGGQWPDRARTAAVELVKATKNRAASVGVQLLRDLKTVFEDAESLGTEAILRKLKEVEEGPWATIRKGEPLDARGLSSRLGKYGVTPGYVVADGVKVRGYTASSLRDAWTRYLPPPEPVGPQTSVPSVPPVPRCTVCSVQMTFPGDIELGHHAGCAS